MTLSSLSAVKAAEVEGVRRTSDRMDALETRQCGGLGHSTAPLPLDAKLALGADR